MIIDSIDFINHANKHGCTNTDLLNCADHITKRLEQIELLYKTNNRLYFNINPFIGQLIVVSNEPSIIDQQEFMYSEFFSVIKSLAH